MSEPIPESIPTSRDPRSKRPTKRLALTPTTQQAAQVTALFAKPDRDISIPPSSQSSTRPSTLPPPPEIVANVQGSSAGAGSGEFHVYKASRRREYERLRLMDEEVKREKADEEYERQKEERRKRDEAKTNKNKAKREKMKAKKGKKGEGKAGSGEEAMEVDAPKKKIQVRKLANEADDADGAMVQDSSGNPTAAEGPNNPEEIGVIIHDDD